jgi:hypothetical protein
MSVVRVGSLCYTGGCLFSLPSINIHTSQPELFFLHLPRKMDPIEDSETSAFKPQTPGKYPKENILHLISCLFRT